MRPLKPVHLKEDELKAILSALHSALWETVPAFRMYDQLQREAMERKTIDIWRYGGGLNDEEVSRLIHHRQIRALGPFRVD